MYFAMLYTHTHTFTHSRPNRENHINIILISGHRNEEEEVREKLRISKTRPMVSHHLLHPNKNK